MALNDRSRLDDKLILPAGLVLYGLPIGAPLFIRVATDSYRLIRKDDIQVPKAENDYHQSGAKALSIVQAEIDLLRRHWLGGGAVWHYPRRRCHDHDQQHQAGQHQFHRLQCQRRLVTGRVGLCCLGTA